MLLFYILNAKHQQVRSTMKAIIKAISLTAATFTVSLTGCKKCYECSTLTGSFTCYKGSDSVKFIAYRTNIIDSLNKYFQGSYDCDTGYLVYIPYDNIVCEKKYYNEIIGKGDKCIEK